jgi:hypothetical protein
MLGHREWEGKKNWGTALVELNRNHTHNRTQKILKSEAK